jgi:hypothetical protein
MTSSSDIIVLSSVNCVSQAGVAVHKVTSGEVQRRTHSSRSSVVSHVSSRRDFVDERNDIDQVAREAEMQVHNEEVTLRDSTVQAQLLAQGERARAAKAAKVAQAQVQVQIQA